MNYQVLRHVVAAYHFPADLVAHLFDESHRSHPSTFAVMRYLYVLTRGRLRSFLLGVFRLLRRCKGTAEPQLLDGLRKNGIAVIPGFLSGHQARLMYDYFVGQPGFSIGEGFARTPARVDTMGQGLKLEYAPNVILGAPGIQALMENEHILEIAAAYLRCQPIFTGVAAWWSFPDTGATQSDLGWAAQKFHFDYDWPAFIKFFIYLSDVECENGPFTFVLGTHEKKKEWVKGRMDDEYILSTYGNAVKQFTGKYGDMIVADTAGYHKGMRVIEGRRLILQLEFAVSRLGASCQYELLPRELRPTQCKGHTFDVFSG